METTFNFTSKLIKSYPDELIGCKVEGDDLKQIPAGSIVWIDPAIKPKSNDYVLYTYKGILYLRKLYKNLLINDKNDEPHPLDDSFEYLGAVVSYELPF